MKINKFLSSIIVLILIFASIFAMVGCNGGNGKGVYTYNEYISASPTSWNSHIGTSDADSYVQTYTEMGFYDVTLSADKTTYAFVDEMAVGDPVDVTADYVGKYEVKTGETGRAYKINLNPSATWANGEKITSADYLYSMEQLLSPQMKNSKASAFYTGTTELYNAYNYYMNNGEEMRDYARIANAEELTDTEIQDMIYRGELFFSLTQISFLEGADPANFSLKAYYEKAKGYLDDETKTTWHKIYKAFFHRNGEGDNITIYGDSLVDVLSSDKYEVNADGYVKVTTETFEEVREYLNLFSSFYPSYAPHWYNLCARGLSTTVVYNKITKTTSYTDQEIANLIESGRLYFSLTQIPILEGLDPASFALAPYFATAEGYLDDETKTTWHKIYKAFFHKDDGGEIYGDSIIDVLSADKYVANDAGYVKVTMENLEEVKEYLGLFSTDYSSFAPHWYNLCAIQDYEGLSPAEFSEVGIEADGDYAIVLIFKLSLSTFDVKYALTGNWLVYKDLYEAGKQQQGALTLTNYGTSLDTYMSYGPYKLVSYQKDKELVFERNTAWYGYDSKATNYHEGQFQTTRIVAQIIRDQSTALLEFEKGNLDQVRLSSNDLDKYKFSDYLLKRTGGNIWQIAFNADVDALEAIEADGQGNRRILSLVEFRKALSLCLNRTTIGAEIAAGSAPAFSYINDNYYYDMQNDPNSIYRASDEGMQAIVDLYGIEYGAGKKYATLKEAYSAVTGYDIDQAKADFTTAYNKAIEEGIYTNGQTIKINIYTNDLNATRSAIGQYMQSQVDLATQGTALEGKIKIEWKQQESGRNEDLNQGKIEASFYSSIADYSDPYGFLALFTDPENTLLEYGFDPTKESVTLTYDFDGDGEAEEVTKTYYEWQKAISAGGTYASDVDARLFVLARLEYQLLSNFQTIPLYVGTDVLLYSKKVTYATTNANIFAVYGGLRLMTYKYDDAEWAKYCKKNTLNYAE